MLNENNKDSFLRSLRKDLERELERLKIEKEQEKEISKKESIELVKKELAEAERKNAEKIKELESKLKKFYYWLFGTFFVLSVVIIGVFFYFRSFLGK